MRIVEALFLVFSIFTFGHVNASTSYVNDLDQDSFKKITSLGRGHGKYFGFELGGNLFCPWDNYFFYENPQNPSQSFGAFARSNGLIERLITQTYIIDKKYLVIYATRGDKRLDVDWGLMFDYRDQFFWLDGAAAPIIKQVTLGQILEACPKLSERLPD